MMSERMLHFWEKVKGEGDCKNKPRTHPRKELMAQSLERKMLHNDALGALEMILSDNNRLQEVENIDENPDNNFDLESDIDADDIDDIDNDSSER
jgi:hypothetical protein